MKKTKEKKVVTKEANEFKIESSASVIKDAVESIGTRGRASRFPLVKIPVGSGVFLGKGTVISKISPLVHYFNSRSNRHLRCKTIDRSGERGVFVYRVADVKKEQVAA